MKYRLPPSILGLTYLERETGEVSIGITADERGFMGRIQVVGGESSPVDFAFPMNGYEKTDAELRNDILETISMRMKKLPFAAVPEENRSALLDAKAILESIPSKFMLMDRNIPRAIESVAEALRSPATTAGQRRAIVETLLQSSELLTSLLDARAIPKAITAKILIDRAICGNLHLGIVEESLAANRPRVLLWWNEGDVANKSPGDAVNRILADEAIALTPVNSIGEFIGALTETTFDTIIIIGNNQTLTGRDYEVYRRAIDEGAGIESFAFSGKTAEEIAGIFRRTVR